MNWKKYEMGRSWPNLRQYSDKCLEGLKTTTNKVRIIWVLANICTKLKKLKLNSVVLVRERIILTERPSLVGEVSANFLRIEGVAWSAQQIPTVVNLGFLDRSRYYFFQVAPQLSSRG
jgi:hypothetical protein